MNTSVTLSLPVEQAEMIERMAAYSEKVFKALNKSVWLDESEAAERLKVSGQTIAKWRKEGWLRHIKEPGSNGKVHYRADQFDEDVEAKLGVVKFR